MGISRNKKVRLTSFSLFPVVVRMASNKLLALFMVFIKKHYFVKTILDNFYFEFSSLISTAEVIWKLIDDSDKWPLFKKLIIITQKLLLM